MLNFIKNIFQKKEEAKKSEIKHKQVTLMILDGFGVSPDKVGSPWELAKHPTFLQIEKNYPFTTLQASGIAVGLPWGKEGNSEVGHLAIGSGRIIYNHLPRISTSINDGTFYQNETFLKTVEHISKNPNHALHLMGLFSSGTVHTYAEHLYALLEFASQQKIEKVFLHLFTDGQDAYYKEGEKFFAELEDRISSSYPNIKIASIIGRKYPMNRDAHWDRTEKAYKLFVDGEGFEFMSASEYIETEYQNGRFDGDTAPAKIANEESRIKDNDAVIFYNFREDSPRQLVRAFTEENFDKFQRRKLNNLMFVTMTEYDKNFSAIPAFKSTEANNTLAQVISENNLKQLHLAETVKYAHITYFLNGGKEIPFANEDRNLIKSKQVPSFALSPEMSASEIADDLISNLGKYDFIAINFANADMVGHTGDFQATIKAMEKLDECIGRILPKILRNDGVLIITADHGNAEEKTYKMTGEKKSEHSINPVPFYLIGNDFKKEIQTNENEINKSYQDVKGTLADIAPTILELMNIATPPEMTGKSLLDKLNTGGIIRV